MHLYKPDGNGGWIYITDWEGHIELHDYWDFMGGSPRIGNDANHYSLEWNGVR
jgi:hypothetical protein